MAMYGLLFIGILGVGINAWIRCDDGDDGIVYCDTCCSHGCCVSDYASVLSAAGIVGIIMAAVVAMILFCGCCICAIRRRRQFALAVRKTRSRSAQVSTYTVSTNPAHAGYKQPVGNMTMSPPPYPGPVVQEISPAYDTRNGYPLRK